MLDIIYFKEGLFRKIVLITIILTNIQHQLFFQTGKYNALIGPIDMSSKSQANDTNNSGRNDVRSEEFNVSEIQDNSTSLKIIKDLVINGIRTDWNQISKHSPDCVRTIVTKCLSSMYVNHGQSPILSCGL